MSGTLKGIDGNTSGKRVAGFVLVAGVLIIAGIAIWRDPTQAQAVLWPLVSFGSVCFGATAVERIGSNK